MPKIWDFTCIYSNYGPLNVPLGLDTSVDTVATGDSRVHKCAYQRGHCLDPCVNTGATFSSVPDPVPIGKNYTALFYEYRVKLDLQKLTQFSYLEVNMLRTVGNVDDALAPPRYIHAGSC
jgi:hypothetical protein